MKWEFAEHGTINIGGMEGISGFICSQSVGEYTTFIDVKTQKKKHIVKNLDFKYLKKFLSEDGEDYNNTGLFTGIKSKKHRWIDIKKKFVNKLNKKNIIIIDSEWLK